MKTLHFTKNIKLSIALLAFSLFFNLSWGQIDLSNYDLINTGDANDPVTVSSYSKQQDENHPSPKTNYATNTLDKDNATVWAADDDDVLSGDYKGDGEYIIYDLGASQDVRLIQFTTTSKSDSFGYQVWVSTTGTDAGDFTKILPTTGDILLTLINSTEFNQYEIQDGVNARYIKIIGFGRFNTAGDTRTSAWNAIGEIEFYESGSGSGGDTGTGTQTELVLNGTADMWTTNTGDNADAWDMTPNSTIVDNSGTEIDSPYRALWRNDDLEDALGLKYLGTSGASLDEQPGATSSGNNGTRGVKLYDDGSPSITGSSRRLYQLVKGLTVGNTYDFSIDSKSEAANTPSEVYILNNEITSEDGIDANKYADSSVTAGMDITNDEGTWVTNTMSFVATTTDVVIYVRALAADSGDTEVFYDNISLKASATASVNDVFASSLKIYPNPATQVVNISTAEEINKIDVFSLQGKKVISVNKLNNNSLDVSSLSSGIYLMKLASGNSIASKKLIIK